MSDDANVESDPSDESPGVLGTPGDLEDDAICEVPRGGSSRRHLFPNNNRRRIPAYLYWVIALICVAIWLGSRGGDPVLVNDGLVFAAGFLALFGVYSFVAGRNLRLDENDALVVAVAQVGFPVGHSSAQLGWRGLLSRPTWRILIYSAEEQPTKRGLVLVDGADGTVVEWFVEDNPEDWSDLDARR